MKRTELDEMERRHGNSPCLSVAEESHANLLALETRVAALEAKLTVTADRIDVLNADGVLDMQRAIREAVASVGAEAKIGEGKGSRDKQGDSCDTEPPVAGSSPASPRHRDMMGDPVGKPQPDAPAPVPLPPRPFRVGDRVKRAKGFDAPGDTPGRVNELVPGGCGVQWDRGYESYIAEEALEPLSPAPPPAEEKPLYRDWHALYRAAEKVNLDLRTQLAAAIRERDEARAQRDRLHRLIEELREKLHA